MHQEGYVVALLSGELDVTQRATILKRFRDGKERVLVTTNVCARGIDVEQVTLVVNFDLPMTKVCFLSRILRRVAIAETDKKNDGRFLGTDKFKGSEILTSRYLDSKVLDPVFEEGKVFNFQINFQIN